MPDSYQQPVRCSAYKCTSLAGEIFPFCPSCSSQLNSDEAAMRIKRLMRGRRWTRELLAAISDARVRIAQMRGVSAIEIDQFMHHDEIAMRRFGERERRVAKV